MCRETVVLSIRSLKVRYRKMDAIETKKVKKSAKPMPKM